MTDIIVTLTATGKAVEGPPSADSDHRRYSTVLSPVLLMTTELSLDDEKPDPLDLLPLLELEDELDRTEMLGPDPLPDAEMPGPLLDGARSASLWVQAPSAR